MSESMFGERYFATRERLADVMRRIAELAVETGTDLADVLPLGEIENGLGPPFLFVLCGEVNAGKSSLINGLCGLDLCPVNILPETNRVFWYRHGTPSRDVEVTYLLEERYRPIPFLRDFHLVDTPGTNSAVQGHDEIIGRFLPTADLVLFVFPVTNPWGASTWNVISQLPRETLDRAVFIVQQADQCDAKDIDVILGHMADLSMKRIGHVPPIFAVSGKLAYEAKLATPVDAGLLKASGCPALEDFISKNVCQSTARKNALETWRAQASTALHRVEDDIEKQTRGINGQNRFIELVEHEIDGIREKFVTRLPSHLAGVAAVFETEAVWVTKLLRRRLGAFSSIIRLFTGDHTAYQMESV
ncbi:MAG: dynamin family protein, partial [Verrucomicrobiota bacterium]